MADARILQLTDLHLFHDLEVTLKGIPTRRTLKSIADSILQDGIEFDRLIITGDHTHDEHPESYTAAREMFAPWLDRLAIIPGNHDDRDVMRSVYDDVIRRQVPGDIPNDDRITFSFYCGSWLCLGLDTHAPGQVSGQCGLAQATWLSERLAEHGDNPSVVFCHHPPINVGSEWMDAIGLEDRSLLQNIVKDYPCLRLICCGHVHHEFEGLLGSTRVVTTPSTGLQLDPGGTRTQFASDPPGYRVIEFTEHQMRTHVVRLTHAEHTPSNT